MRACTRDSMNERRSEGVHPLGEPRRRHYVVYLAFNLINEGRSVSVDPPLSLSLPFSLLVSLPPYLSFHERTFFPGPSDFPRSGERMEKRPSANGRKGPLNVYLRPEVALFVREIRRERARKTGDLIIRSTTMMMTRGMFLRVVEPLYYWGSRELFFFF